MKTQTRYRAIAMLIILSGAQWQFGLEFVEWKLMSTVWSASTGLFVALLLALVANAYRSRAVLAAVGINLACALLTTACNVKWLLWPWVVKESGSRCSAALNIPAGILAAVAFLVTAWRIYEGTRDV